MGPRAGLSTVLVCGALVLLTAIAIGNNMGNRVLGQIANRGPGAVVTPVPSPSVGDEDNADQVLWKRRRVLSVATDPAFPDPRVTPQPPPPPITPRPAPQQTRTPRPTPSALEDEAAPPYTSPPMPIPLVSHPAGETSPPEEDGASEETSRTNPTPRPAATGNPLATASPGVSTINP